MTRDLFLYLLLKIIIFHENKQIHRKGVTLKLRFALWVACDKVKRNLSKEMAHEGSEY